MVNSSFLKIFADEIFPVDIYSSVYSAAKFSGLSPLAEISILLAVCLISTIIIETLLAHAFKVKGKNLLVVLLAQIVTNPIVVLISNLVMITSPWSEQINHFYITMAIMEVVAIFVEGLMYKAFFRDYKFIHPLLLSFLLNLISVVVGFAGSLIIASI